MLTSHHLGTKTPSTQTILHKVGTGMEKYKYQVVSSNGLATGSCDNIGFQAFLLMFTLKLIYEQYKSRMFADYSSFVL